MKKRGRVGHSVTPRLLLISPGGGYQPLQHPPPMPESVQLLFSYFNAFLSW